MKICCTCKLLKSCFCKNKNNDDELSAQCKDCAKKYRDEHKEDRKLYKSSNKEYRHNYRSNNKDHINHLKRVKNNPNYKEKQELNLKLYGKHLSKKSCDKLGLDYYETNKIYFANKNRMWFENNKQAANLRHRARKLRLGYVIITQKDINDLIDKFDNKCFYCKCDVVRGINLHLDHKVPLCRNGQHSLDNLVPSCKTCNLQKGRKTDIEFKGINVVKNS